MNVVAHFLFGVLVACYLFAFGVELPRVRRGLGRSTLDAVRIGLIMIMMGGLAAFPQTSKLFGDKKLDSGPLLNLFVFHDVLELLGQRFRLGDGLLDPPVMVFGVVLAVGLMLLIYLRSDSREGWEILWRDAAYFFVVILCLVAVRSAVSGKGYLFMPRTGVFVDGNPYTVIQDTVFSSRGAPVVGRLRDKALAVRDAFVAVNSTRWVRPPPEVGLFLQGSYDVPPLEYDSLVRLLATLRQTPDVAPAKDVSRIFSAGSLPRNDIPLPIVIGLPLLVLGACGFMLYPFLDL